MQDGPEVHKLALQAKSSAVSDFIKFQGSIATSIIIYCLWPPSSYGDRVVWPTNMKVFIFQPLEKVFQPLGRNWFCGTQPCQKSRERRVPKTIGEQRWGTESCLWFLSVEVGFSQSYEGLLGVTVLRGNSDDRFPPNGRCLVFLPTREVGKQLKSTVTSWVQGRLCMSRWKGEYTVKEKLMKNYNP